jgi:hypothetical protein
MSERVSFSLRPFDRERELAIIAAGSWNWEGRRRGLPSFANCLKASYVFTGDWGYKKG